MDESKRHWPGAWAGCAWFGLAIFTYILSIGPAYRAATFLASRPGPDREWPYTIVRFAYAPVFRLAVATNSEQDTADYINWWFRKPAP